MHIHIYMSKWVLCCVTTDIKLSFERARYDVKGKTVELNDTIHIVKEDDRISEQTLGVSVTFNQSSGNVLSETGEN